MLYVKKQRRITSHRSANSKQIDVGSGYKTLASNLLDFFKLFSKLVPFQYKFLNEGGGDFAEHILVSNRAFDTRIVL